MKEVATIILGGGEGTRLYLLTVKRCKPAVCFGGKYRLIDIPISNAIHFGCNKNFILTKFLSSSLHQQIVMLFNKKGLLLWMSLFFNHFGIFLPKKF